MPYQRKWAIGIVRGGGIVQVPERLQRITLHEAATFVEAYSQDNDIDGAAILHHPISAAILAANSKSRDS